ncbi:hypothetical protein F4778DRAFT_794244 [Xylariomycetidae sp. FL2044]|nr:hypothetical protein F4778DRAFT_794244 [Xylariomycetidae sp. FL2044]
MAGNIYPKPPIAAALPPFIPIPPGGADWDTAVVVHGPELFNVRPTQQDRRHSGWEQVEKSWAEKAGRTHKSTAAKRPSAQKEEGGREAMIQFPYPNVSIPRPNFESEFRMKIVLSSQSASVAINDGFKKWTTFTEGTWSGRFGHGIVDGGGQYSRDLVQGKTLATEVEATHRLRTSEDLTAIIECKTRGFRTGPAQIMKALQDPQTAEEVDPRQYQYRVFITMKTSDERYAEKLNFGMWIGSCLWKNREIVYE